MQVLVSVRQPRAAPVCSSSAWTAVQGRSLVVPSTCSRSTAGLADVRLCQVHPVPALKTRSLLAAKIGAGIRRSKQLVFNLNLETDSSLPFFDCQDLGTPLLHTPSPAKIN